MKAFKIFSFLLVSLLALASCSKEKDEVIAADDNIESVATAKDSVVIYVKLVNGAVAYSDSLGNFSRSLNVNAKQGNIIVWKLADNSGIKAITAIAVDGGIDFFAAEPKQVDIYKWTATINGNAKGEVSFDITFESFQTINNVRRIIVNKTEGEPLPPQIKIKP